MRVFSSVKTLAALIAVTAVDPSVAVGGDWGYELKLADGETVLVFTNTVAKEIRWTVPEGVTKLETLVVGGGGGGGYGGANEKGAAEMVGGGGGGFAQALTLDIGDARTVEVTVGAGGAGGTYETYDGLRGGDSTLVCGEVTVTSLGGGFGGGCCLGISRAGGAGGCGGGGAILGDGGGACEQGGSGWGWQAATTAGGGGAGACERSSGSKRNSFKRWQGGAGLTNSISGTAVEYGRGGDGSMSGQPVRDGVNGTGAGGAGGLVMMGGRGGDGVVVLRFLPQGSFGTPVTVPDGRPLGGKPVKLSPSGGQVVSLLTPLQKELFSKSVQEREQILSAVGTAERKSLFADLVNPSVPPTLSWSGTVGRCTVTVADAADGRAVFTCETEGTSVKVNTLRAGASYRWTVTSADSQVGEATFSVEPDVPHLVVGDWGALNARDMGGYAGLGGKRVRQGVAWRMTRFTQTLDPAATLLDPGRCFFWTNTVGVRTEIDLRDRDLGSSVLGPNVKYVFCKIGIYTMTDRDRENQIKAFRLFLNPENYPIAFHCSGGRDRTGTLAYLLNGLLGVSDDDLEKDYQATWLRLPKESLADCRHGDRSLDNVIATVDACSGATRAEKIANYFKAGGVTDDEIALFRKHMLVDATEGPEEPISPDEPPSGGDDPPLEPLRAGVSDCVDTRLGTGVGSGSCMVGPCVPHGSVYPSPDTEWPAEGRKIPPPNGYYAGDKVVGFSQLHTQGTGGVPSYGLFRVSFGAPSRLEILEAHPYRFRGRLSDIGVEVAISATAHGAIYTHTGGEATVDALCKIARRKASRDAKVTVRGNEIFGGGTYSGNWNPAPYGCWFYATKTNGCLRIAVSFKSVEQAKDYHRLELDGRSIDEISASARAAWDEVLSRVSVKGLAYGTETAFYTHLFHAFVQPRDRSEDGLGWDDHYTLWDTWKTLFPLMTLVDPGMVAGNVNSFAERFARTGRCEACYTQGCEYKVGQGGDEVDCVIADASAKDVPGIDWQKLCPLLESRWTGRTASYRERGWVADGEREDYCWRMKSGSGTMSFAYQDFCAGRTLRRRGGDLGIAARLIARSTSWTNVWNVAGADAGFHGFAVARRADGSFVSESPRKGYNTSFYEATGWEYSFFAPHDLAGLVRLCGGEKDFVRRLDFAFAHKLINFGNEPSFYTPWLFAQAGRPNLTDKWAHAVLNLFPAEGCPGDDDSGAMGAYYVFLIAGLMPVAGSDLYVLHCPAAEEIVFRLPQTGAKLVVRRSSRDAINGRPLVMRSVRHAELLKGGVLEIATPATTSST